MVCSEARAKKIEIKICQLKQKNGNLTEKNDRDIYILFIRTVINRFYLLQSLF